MKCSSCQNEWACDVYKDWNNPYGIKQIKFAVLMTYANVGKPKRGDYEKN